VTTAPATIDIAAMAARLRLGVTRLARKLRQEAEPGITPSMLAAMSSLARLGPLTMRDLCAAEQVQPPTMTRVVHALVEAGLVTRTPDPDDGRVAWIGLSAKGDKLLERSRRRKEAYLARALGRLEPRELAVLEDAAAILERLTGAAP
jgi:DNA-binding MarR family transcriptional regulator